MQDIHPIGGGSGGGSGRFFGAGDRRLRHPNHQALRCPRCDSPNTKFCYYNNYNLSQPRHFCKSCRRYWTKGGVLRNVPVGGGCRKTKRSKQKSSAAPTGDATRELSSNAQSSSSESSSLTGATMASTSTSTTTAVAEEGSVPSNTLSKCTVVFNCADGRFFNANPSFDHHSIVDQQADGPFFPTEESFASLMTSSADVMGFGMADIPGTLYGRAQQENQAPVSLNPGEGMVRTTPEEDFKMQEMTGGINDDGLAAALEWGTSGGGGRGGDQGLFDLTAAVDPAYWGQPQWTANDHQSDYLP